MEPSRPPDAGLTRVSDPPGASGLAPAARTAHAATAYFAVMLAAGLVLSPLRDRLINGGLDPVLAFLAQQAVMLATLAWAAGWVIGAFDAPSGLVHRLALGFGAVAAMAATDLTVHAFHAPLTPLELAPRLAQPEGLVIAAALFVSALFPSARGDA